MSQFVCLRACYGTTCKLSRSIFCLSPKRDRSGIDKAYIARIATKESGKKTSKNVQVILQRALKVKYNMAF
jgi:hypothetical protein